jgi:RimJ/RimL family protein N-acetyltransferase
MSSKITIRKATDTDAHDLANILCASWQAAYKDILSPEDLDRNTNKEARTTMFERIVSSDHGNSYIAFCDGFPCGHFHFGDTRDNDLPEYAEIVAIYLTKPYWGTCVGQRMMDFAIAEIKRLGYSKVMLWVFKDNSRARRFYEKNGFVADGTVKDSGFSSADEVRYRLDVLVI